MSTNNFDSYNSPLDIQNVNTEVMSKTFISKVFTWMFAGLSVTGILSYLFAFNPALSAMIQSTVTAVGADGVAHTRIVATGLGYFVMFAPFGLLFLINLGANRLSYPSMVGIFLVFSALLGISLSSIFLVYTSASIGSVFFITAAMFGVMAVLGYTTHIDLTKFGSLMFMLLIGVIISSIVNSLFLHSGTFYYVISFISVAIFTGLTAYDVQKLKKIGAEMTGDNTMVGKASIFGALSLYLDFINLFLSLLSIFGERK